DDATRHREQSAARRRRQQSIRETAMISVVRSGAVAASMLFAVMSTSMADPANRSSQSAIELPKEMLGTGCRAIGWNNSIHVYFRPSLVGREHCDDFHDGITISQDGFSDNHPAVP